MGRRFSWVIGLLMLAGLTFVGVSAYQLGVARGLAEAQFAGAPAAGVPVMVWPHPWGFGFGFFPFFPFFPLLFILFWVFALRGLFWRRAWYGGGCGSRGVPPAFDEWHRRAHAAEGPPAAGTKA